MSNHIFLHQIIKGALSHINACQSLVQMRIQVDPYISSSHPIFPLQPALKQAQELAKKLVNERKVAPQILSCNLLSNTLTFVGGVSGVQDEYVLMRSFQSSQDWANSSIRELNQNDLEEKELRQVIIKMRNCLEDCCDQLKEGLKPSYHHKILDILI